MSDRSIARSIAARRAGLGARLRSLEAQLDAIRGSRGDATADDEHDPEGSTLSSEWSRAEGQRSDVAREIAALDSALQRVGAGTYGRCQSCGESIPAERLALLPGATLCVPCASRLR